MTPAQILRTYRKDYVSVPDLARALNIDYTTLFFRMRDIPEAERIEAHGAFKAGGRWTMTLDAGCDWLDHHQRYWAERQTLPKHERRSAR